jgi:Xaa-Pro dipeptidase
MFEHRGTLTAAAADRPRLAAMMIEAGVDAAVVTTPENVFYLSGYPTLPTSGNPILYSLRNVFPFSLVLDRSGKRTLICWAFSVQDVDVAVDEVVTFHDRRSASEALAATLSRSLGENAGPPRIGVESAAPYDLVCGLRASIADAEIVPVMTQALLSCRRVKTEQEIRLLRRSVQIAEGALERVLAALTPGMSRLAATRLAKQAVLDLGGDGVGHVTMSFGGANPEIAIDEPLRDGALAVIDIGAKFEGYTSDCRRYAFLGDALPPVLAERHATMCGIVAQVASHLVPGASYAEVLQAGRDCLTRAGRPLPPRFTHVGHGIGLETEEEWFDDDPGQTVAEGMVAAIELYTPAEPLGNVGDEETYVVRVGGPERLSLMDTAIRLVRA